MGSLLTAVASYADARFHSGKWLLRMEDLDPPREMQGAADNILFTLEKFGFEWDGEVAYQSQRHAFYRDALDDLRVRNLVYPCDCSRKDWHEKARLGADGFVYNGACANKNIFRQPEKSPAWRVRVPDEVIEFDDEIVGHYAQNLAHDIGDFVLLRADGFWAYQLAVVVDDAAQGITHIVRGQDLLVSTPRQIYLQRCLNAPTPHYAHLPLLTNKLGQKWSKQTRADAIDVNQAAAQLRQVMSYLNIPTAPDTNQPHDLLNWTVANWQMTRVPKSAICTQQQP